uniref:uncharacterized protein LOC122601700 n=1 Tax=Erigeron canadensis TaxID=72917 RepID=UPI001CB89B30|nr:uncharacterized protein LOC122601700 [Erigeron canadensis]
METVVVGELFESKKFSTSLFEVSPSDGQEKEPAPNFLAFCKGQGTPKSFIEDLELSIAKELTDTWSARIDLSPAEDIWGDDEDDDSSVDEELLNEYLARLDAKDQTKKEEVMVDLILKDVKNYHVLTTSEKRDWIALQFISRC